MEITTFQDLIKSEESARRYLLGLCWKNHQRFCPRCTERKLYHVSDGRRRCSRCGYTFHDFSQRFVNAGDLTPRQWLWVLKFFELETPASSMAEQLGVAYNTAAKAMNTVRRAIVSQALDSAQLYAAGVWPGPGRTKPETSPGASAKDSPVFGLVQSGNWAFCDVIPGLVAADLLHFKMNFQLRTACVGQIVYTAPYKHYQTLVACGPSLWPATYIRHNDKHVPADTSSDFWRYVKDRTKARRGISAAALPLHLKEMEFRYNNKNNDAFLLLAKALCSFVPYPPVQEKSP